MHRSEDEGRERGRNFNKLLKAPNPRDVESRPTYRECGVACWVSTRINAE